MQTQTQILLPETIEVLGPVRPHAERILTRAALGFVADLARAHGGRIAWLLSQRRVVQQELDRGQRLDFLPETDWVRSGDWRVAPIPADLEDRRVEITGPVDRKMIINALNSGAKVFMADFEDSTAPTWDNVVDGQVNLRDAVRRSIEFTDERKGKEYRLDPQIATLMVRPRGLHLPELHLRVDGRSVPAALVDFGLYFFHNARALIERGSGPYFYLPKLESHLEARLWNDVFLHAQEALGIPRGTIRATVLIETITAAFQMEEILYELREHSAGLNCGRWDYIFSFIKKHRNDPRFVMPDRARVTMTKPFMRAYTQLCVQTCHRRGAHAMGGMAAQIPIKRDPDANAAALAKVSADKKREARDGHDGTWVAHPGLVPIALEAFDAVMPGPNQIATQLRDDVAVTAADLLEVPTGPRTLEGLRINIRVGVQYLEAWLRGLGCVPLYDLMEDAATAEISRTQIWQWLRHGAEIDGDPLTVELFRQALESEMTALRQLYGEDATESGKFREAAALFDALCTAETFEEFLTLPAYQVLVSGSL